MSEKKILLVEGKFIDNDEEAIIAISEAATVSIVRRTQTAKLNALIGVLALNVAKEKGDPLYKQYRGLNRKRLKIKAQLIRKYAAKVKPKARQILFGKKAASKESSSNAEKSFETYAKMGTSVYKPKV